MTDTSRNPATMTNEELHAHFSALLVSRAEDVDTRLGEFDTKLTNAMDKIDGFEKSFNDKLDGTRTAPFTSLFQGGFGQNAGTRTRTRTRPIGTLAWSTAHSDHRSDYWFGCRRTSDDYRCS